MSSNNGDTPPHLPIIDLSNPTESTSRALLQAAIEWGFLYIRFLGLPFSAEDVNSLFEISREFFNSSKSEKEQYKITPDDRGWSAPYNETLDENARNEPGDFKEAFHMGEFKDDQPQQLLPPALFVQQAFLAEMQDKSRQLCLQLLEHFATALEIPSSAGGNQFFSSCHAQASGTTGSILRLLYYPTSIISSSSSSSSSSTTTTNKSLRCGAHTDFGTLTLLFQRPGQAGLEIEAVNELEGSSDKHWPPVPIFPPTTANDTLPPIVVNIGDLLQFWTKGLLRSTRHRVVVPASGDQDRYSIAYFCHPAGETRLVGVPSGLIRERGAIANSEGEDERKNLDEDGVITAGEHLRRKLDRAYGWDKTAART